MILLGYHPTSGYKLLNPKTMKIVVSRDVKVDELKEWIWDAEEQGPTRVTFELSDPERSDVVPAPACEQAKPQRTRQAPPRFQDYEMIPDTAVNSEGELIHFALLAETEPVSFEEAIEDPNWVDAMKEELKAIEKNETWTLTELPPQKKSIAVKWVYKVKLNLDSTVNKLKARLVAKTWC